MSNGFVESRALTTVGIKPTPQLRGVSLVGINSDLLQDTGFRSTCQMSWDKEASTFIKTFPSGLKRSGEILSELANFPRFSSLVFDSTSNSYGGSKDVPRTRSSLELPH